MTRLILKAIDVGASAVFVALGTKAFCVHFYRNVKQQVHKRDATLRINLPDNQARTPSVEALK